MTDAEKPKPQRSRKKKATSNAETNGEVSENVAEAPVADVAADEAADAPVGNGEVVGDAKQGKRNKNKKGKAASADEHSAEQNGSVEVPAAEPVSASVPAPQQEGKKEGAKKDGAKPPRPVQIWVEDAVPGKDGAAPTPPEKHRGLLLWRLPRPPMTRLRAKLSIFEEGAQTCRETLDHLSTALIVKRLQLDTVRADLQSAREKLREASAPAKELATQLNPTKSLFEKIEKETAALLAMKKDLMYTRVTDLEQETAELEWRISHESGLSLMEEKQIVAKLHKLKLAEGPISVYLERLERLRQLRVDYQDRQNDIKSVKAELSNLRKGEAPHRAAFKESEKLFKELQAEITKVLGDRRKAAADLSAMRKQIDEVRRELRAEERVFIKMGKQVNTIREAALSGDKSKVEPMIAAHNEKVLKMLADPSFCEKLGKLGVGPQDDDEPLPSSSAQDKADEEAIETATTEADTAVPEPLPSNDGEIAAEREKAATANFEVLEIPLPSFKSKRAALFEEALKREKQRDAAKRKEEAAKPQRDREARVERARELEQIQVKSAMKKELKHRKIERRIQAEQLAHEQREERRLRQKEAEEQRQRELLRRQREGEQALHEAAATSEAEEDVVELLAKKQVVKGRFTGPQIVMIVVLFLLAFVVCLVAVRLMGGRSPNIPVAAAAKGAARTMRRK